MPRSDQQSRRSPRAHSVTDAGSVDYSYSYGSEPQESSAARSSVRKNRKDSSSSPYRSPNPSTSARARFTDPPINSPTGDGGPPLRSALRHKNSKTNLNTPTFVLPHGSPTVDLEDKTMPRHVDFAEDRDRLTDDEAQYLSADNKAPKKKSKSSRRRTEDSDPDRRTTSSRAPSAPSHHDNGYDSDELPREKPSRSKRQSSRKDSSPYASDDDTDYDRGKGGKRDDYRSSGSRGKDRRGDYEDEPYSAPASSRSRRDQDYDDYAAGRRRGQYDDYDHAHSATTPRSDRDRYDDHGHGRSSKRDKHGSSGAKYYRSDDDDDDRRGNGRVSQRDRDRYRDRHRDYDDYDDRFGDDYGRRDRRSRRRSDEPDPFFGLEKYVDMLGGPRTVKLGQREIVLDPQKAFERVSGVWRQVGPVATPYLMKEVGPFISNLVNKKMGGGSGVSGRRR